MDFFICHNEADKQWAEWISWQLEQAGYKVWNPDWDILPGQNEILAIDKALDDASAQQTERRMILLLSPNFGGSSYQEVSRTSIQALDPDGSKGLLIPVKISDKVNGHIISGAVRTIDLYLYSDERQALDCLLRGIGKQRGKSLKAPFFPGQVQMPQAGKPFFPGSISEQSITSEARVLNRKESVHPLYKLGQFDRRPQRNHLQSYLSVSSSNALHDGFIVYGPPQEWPEGIQYKLANLLQILKKQLINPIDIALDLDFSGFESEPTEFLWLLLANNLNCDSNELAVKSRLEQEKDKHLLLIWKLRPEQMKNQRFLVELLSIWKSLQLQPGARRHYLLMICRSDYIEEKSLFSRIWRKSSQSWREAMESLLKTHNQEKVLLPILETPNPHEHIGPWLESHIKDPELASKIQEKFDEKFSKSSAVPLNEIKNTLEPVLKNHYTQ